MTTYWILWHIDGNVKYGQTLGWNVAGAQITLTSMLKFGSIKPGEVCEIGVITIWNATGEKI